MCPVVFCFIKKGLLMNANTLLELLQNAVAKMYTNDPEITIVAKSEDNCVAEIKENLQALCADSGGVDIDFNYSHMTLPDGNQCAKAVKTPKGIVKSVKPDLICHVRGTHKNNIIAVEIKGWWEDKKKRWERDERKLCGYTDQSSQNILKYKLGVFVALGKKRWAFCVLSKWKAGQWWR